MPDTLAAIPCGEKTFFHISYFLPSDARLDYQLIIDSHYMTDPRNTAITPSGYGPHSQIAMPKFYPDPARAHFRDVPGGSIDSLFFTSKDPKIIPRKIKVYLPSGYESLEKMPVLYVMDGLEALAWMDYPNVLDNMIAWKKIEPMIAVFIPPGERSDEFMGTKYKVFQDVLCNEIVETIDNRYHTDTRATARGITGISAGGYFAMMTVLTHPEVFGCGAGQSPAITAETFKTLDNFVKKGKNNSSIRIYFDMGRYDLSQEALGDMTFVQAGEKLHQEMQKLKLDHRYQVTNDGHEWANWRERTGEILIYFFR